MKFPRTHTFHMNCSSSKTDEFSKLFRGELSTRISMMGANDFAFIIRFAYTSPGVPKQCRKNFNAARG